MLNLKKKSISKFYFVVKLYNTRYEQALLYEIIYYKVI